MSSKDDDIIGWMAISGDTINDLRPAVWKKYSTFTHTAAAVNKKSASVQPPMKGCTV